jgi:hypothetical protein
MKYVLWIVAGIAVVSAASWGPIVSNVEQPKYEVVETDKAMEIREYAPMIVAETEMSGGRREAIGEGFRTIAAYIFGGNRTSQKIAMTAPVTQQATASAAITTPRTHQRDGEAWRVRFVMPANYKMETLPAPGNPAVTLRAVEPKRFAVIRFSGMARESSLESRLGELQDFIQSRKLRAVAAPVYAFYNPPWTLPFLRRNEIMIEIGR